MNEAEWHESQKSEKEKKYTYSGAHGHILLKNIARNLTVSSVDFVAEYLYTAYLYLLDRLKLTDPGCMLLPKDPQLAKLRMACAPYNVIFTKRWYLLRNASYIFATDMVGAYKFYLLGADGCLLW